MNIVIGISGKINSGKTTVAQFIANELKSNSVSFGNYVKQQAGILGLDKSRKVLQDLGQQLFEDDVNDFCKKVLYSDKWTGDSDLVVDGVRHTDVYYAIKKLVSPLKFYLLYVSTDDATRKERLTTDSLHMIDSHPTEKDLSKELLLLADFVIFGNNNFEENKQEIINWVAKLKSY